jgi:hypothetical protein
MPMICPRDPGSGEISSVCFLLITSSIRPMRPALCSPPIGITNKIVLSQIIIRRKMPLKDMTITINFMRMILTIL